MKAKSLLNLAQLWTRPKPIVGATPCDVVHHENKWRLLRYRRAPANGTPHPKTPIVLVPSLINRHYVLDLMPGKSFTEYLVGKGHDVFTIDWGTPGPEDRYVTFDDICDGIIGRAMRVAARESPRGKAHLFGYCLGGTLAAIHAAVRREHVASLAVVAAPVRFHDDGLLSAWTRSRQFDVGALVAAFGNVPWQLMQGAFHMLRPTLGASKMVALLDRAWDDEYLDGVLALETWGADNVSLPGAAYERYVEELYRKDALAEGSFTLSGKPVRLEAIDLPVLAVTFEHDNIVPWESAALLVEKAGTSDKERVHLQGGHVGAMVSKSAAKGLWPQMSAWWTARDEAPKAKVKAKTAASKPSVRARRDD
jgi:polyhydroxyalkanoate synthase